MKWVVSEGKVAFHREPFRVTVQAGLRACRWVEVARATVQEPGSGCFNSQNPTIFPAYEPITVRVTPHSDLHSKTSRAAQATVEAAPNHAGIFPVWRPMYYY